MEIVRQYNPRDFEEKMYAYWLDSGVFEADANQGKNPFCVVIPPPNITGILHMGHALNNTIQDVLIRYKRMQGHESLWMPGTDHAGIATQNVVERQLAKEGLGKQDIGRDGFEKRLWKWYEEYGSTIIEQLKKLGASCDWKRTRFTMDEGYSEAVKEVFVKLYKKGLVYRGNYIINWCPRCTTALSDEEAARKEIDGWLYYIRYPVQHTKGKGQEVRDEQKYIVVATTRPETMLGDTAVAINPKDKRYKWLKKAKVILPIMERQLPVVEDKAVDPEFGTGVVKVTPAHDPADFLMGKKHNLEFINIMHENAVLNENAGEFAGMDRFEGRQAILEVLQEKGLIERKEPYKLSAGHCYRCHTVIEPRVSLQWFVRMKPLAKSAIEAVQKNKVKFYPVRWRKVYLNWMENIQDWCISRQIWWGHRIPVYYCTNCIEKKNQKSNIKNEKDEELSKEGMIVAREKPEKCPGCGSKEFIQDEDVLDTWFSSWLWPFATFGWPKVDTTTKRDLEYFYPTDTLVTASEILFFWVARMVMAGLEFMNEIPFRDVLIHGTVRDARGIKMSKSLGNIIDPLEIIDKFGADSLRFSLMMLAASGSDVYLSDEKFLVGRNFCNKIWNATRFLLLKIKDNNVAVDNLHFELNSPIDQWVIKRLNQTIKNTTAHLENYRMNEAAKEVYEFFWHAFCDWYVEIVKDTFRANTAKVALYVLLNSLKLLHPFIPFITEAIFQLLKKSTSCSLDEGIARSSWPVEHSTKFNEQDIAHLDSLLDTIRQIRNIKIDLGMGTKKVNLQVCSKKCTHIWVKNRDWIMRLASLCGIETKEALERVLYANELWALNFTIGDIDTGSFIVSLEKKIKKLDDVSEKVSARLHNRNFLQNASPDTVEQEKAKYDELNTQLRRLKELRSAFT
ncbi:MAG: valine--tRNA ligase [Candidatus Omnitrophota bacterium]|nr:MAG: valine--tRNA ligase [Candidatus Omnitrophota bacterium]